MDVTKRLHGGSSSTSLEFVRTKGGEVSESCSQQQNDEEEDEDKYECSWMVCEVDMIGVVVSGRAKVFQLVASAKICQVDNLVVIAHGADMIDISAPRRRRRGSA